MVDRAGQHVGDGLDAAVRMPGKAAQVVVGHVVAEVVEEQERIDVFGLAKAEGATQMDTGTLERGRGLDVGPDGTKRHGPSLAGDGSCASLPNTVLMPSGGVPFRPAVSA